MNGLYFFTEVLYAELRNLPSREVFWFCYNYFKMLDTIIKFYTDTYGGVIPSGSEDLYSGYFKRAILALQARLGWQLEGNSKVELLGVNPGGCDCEIDLTKLDDAPKVEGKLRVYNFDAKLPNAPVDPFTQVHAVYICKNEPTGSKENEVVILKRITDFQPVYFNSDYGKYIKACRTMLMCSSRCAASCTQCTSLLVDANWTEYPKLPQDLMFLLCDYVNWLAEGGIANSAITSESVDGHSVSYGNRKEWLTPFDTPDAVAIIGDFVGPYGNVNRRQYIR